MPVHYETSFDTLISHHVCDPIIGYKKIAGTEWSDETCALVHGDVSGISDLDTWLHQTVGVTESVCGVRL